MRGDGHRGRCTIRGAEPYGSAPAGDWPLADRAWAARFRGHLREPDGARAQAGADPRTDAVAAPHGRLDHVPEAPRSEAGVCARRRQNGGADAAVAGIEDGSRPAPRTSNAPPAA